MPARDKNDWIHTADEFYEGTNLPNCIGAVDGKHIRVRKPNESGSQFFNYKNFFSTVLMAVAHADYCSISVKVGAYGSSGDSNVFKSRNLENYWRAINWIFQTPGFCPVMQKDYPCHLCL